MANHQFNTRFSPKEVSKIVLNIYESYLGLKTKQFFQKIEIQSGLTLLWLLLSKTFVYCIGKVTTSTQDSVHERFVQSTRRLNNASRDVFKQKDEENQNSLWKIKVTLSFNR